MPWKVLDKRISANFKNSIVFFNKLCYTSNNEVNMRQKFIDKIYMREVTDKEWYLEKDEKLNGYIALKYVKEISKPLTAFNVNV